ncbi:MAG TPA: 4'-phosphopantetheinyl transferase superfamily protein [Parafilimonas sp.]|nr:4'-phosphopantetheinyl transferase superfamily protein [Parafilimonas sp.]
MQSKIVNLPLSLFYQHIINQTTKLGIWKIEEAEDFFLAEVPLQQNITHPHKRLQHLAGRYLLKYLIPDFPYDEILIADTRKPYLPGEQYHFSISHCGDYAAVIVSSTHRVGIDIEIPSPKVERISHKFIHQNEKQWLDGFLAEPQTSNVELQTILWSAKEAIFKWYSLGGVDFKEHMQLSNFIQKQNDNFLLPVVFNKRSSIELGISSRIFERIVLSWVMTEANTFN